MTEADAFKDRILNEEDVPKVVCEILEVQTKSKTFGRILGLPRVTVDFIHQQYSDPQECLFAITEEFVKQVEPPPTWRVIVEALRNPLIGYHHLAYKVERKHCPLTLQQDVVSGEIFSHERSSKNVKERILELNGLFHQLKSDIQTRLEISHVPVQAVANTLTSLLPDEDDYHRIFLESHVEQLYTAANHSVLFGKMNFHWNYLDPSLLDCLIREFDLMEIKERMEDYKLRVQEFKLETPLTVFCETQKRKRVDPTPQFREAVAEFDWPENVTLEVVEQFRQEYASQYNLRDCALMVAAVGPDSHSESISVHGKKSKLSSTSIPPGASTSVAARWWDTKEGLNIPSEKAKKLTSAESIEQPSLEHLSFVEEPSDDFFCPVTYSLLLQPHLTSCCGQHLSQEAIKKTKNACPLCNEPGWKSMFDKHFQRQVNSLKVFCLNKNNGCEWQGGLKAFHHHVKTCPMKNAPQRTRENQQILQMDDDNKIIVAGAPILSKQCFWYTGKEMDFIWKEAGISMHFPATLCEGDIMISVRIFTNREQNCILPQRYQILPKVSAVYEITASAELPAPVRVRVEHCAVVDKEDSLTFMLAHNGPPNKFEPLHHGYFPLNKSHGEIELMKFSLLTILYNILDWKLTLAIHIAYLKDNIVHFLVTKNLPVNCTAVQKIYNRKRVSKLQSYTMQYFYRTTTISLSLPELEPGCDGWCIESSCRPVTVGMLGVHTYEPGGVIPKIELTLKWRGEGKPEKQKVDIGVKGGSMESFTLSCEPTQQSPESLPQSQQSLNQQPQPATTEDQKLPHPTAPLPSDVIRPQLKDLTQELKDLAWSDVHSMAIRLGLKYPTLKKIEEQNSESSSRLSAAMQTWLDSDCQASWKKVVKALEDIGKTVLAKQISGKKLSDV